MVLSGGDRSDRSDRSNRSSSRSASREKSSRIKFKSLDTHTLTSEDNRRLFTNEESAQNLFKAASEDDAEALDDTICYHKNCSFAYNISADFRNPSILVECLPQETYRKLSAMWNLDPTILPKVSANICSYTKDQIDEENKMVDEYIKNVEKDLGIRSEVSEDLQVNASSQHDTISEEGTTKRQNVNLKMKNPYLRFLKKIQMADSDQKKTPNLEKKAGKITTAIIKKFLKWYESLGGGDDEQSFIDEPTLHELFQVGFDMPAAKPMAIRIKEMPTVPETLAILRNEPKHATTYALKQYLKKDIKMENIPMKMFAFGSMLPKEKNLRYKPPKNYVEKTWMECSRVPKDLNTMKTVWVGLERLRSTIAFSNWLKNHPDIVPPQYLQQKGLLDINYEEWNQMYKGFEFDVSLDLIGSEQKIAHDKSFSKASSLISYSDVVKFDESSESVM